MPVCVCVCQWDRKWIEKWFGSSRQATGLRDTHYGAFKEELSNALARNRFLSGLLAFIPIGFISHMFGFPEWMIFVSNFFAVLPMAWLIGKATEDLASSTGDILGGLLNASFGNIVEMLLCIAGIRQGQIALIQCTLIGSILSNMLLVLGTAFLVGGIRYKDQLFSEVSSSLQSSLMLLAVLDIALPTLYCMLVPGNDSIESISCACSILLFFMYGQYLVFQLYTHSDFIAEEENSVKVYNTKRKFSYDGSESDIPRRRQSKDDVDGDHDDDDDDDDEVDLSAYNAAILLGLLTICTAFCSDFLIASMEGFMEAWHVGKEFIGVIVLPIIGNAAEHWTAILSAYKGKMDLALGVAVGSSCQMALLVTPFTVMVGKAVGTHMTLDFHPFQAGVLLLSVLIVANILKDRTANWLVGSMLCTSYFTIGLIYYKASPQIEPSVIYD